MNPTPIEQLTQALRLLEAVRPAVDDADRTRLEDTIYAVLVLIDTLEARSDVGDEAWPAMRAQLEADGLLE